MSIKETVKKIIDEAILDYEIISELFSKNSCDIFIKNKNSVIVEYHPFRILNGERNDILIKIDQIFKIDKAPDIFVKFKDSLQVSRYDNGGHGIGIFLYGEMIAIGSDGTFNFAEPHEEWESSFPYNFYHWEDEDFERLKKFKNKP